jgi:hypothetical protein
VVSATDPHGRNLGFLDPDDLGNGDGNYRTYFWFVSTLHGSER